jgi:hypothetical protein
MKKEHGQRPSAATSTKEESIQSPDDWGCKEAGHRNETEWSPEDGKRKVTPVTKSCTAERQKEENGTIS